MNELDDLSSLPTVLRDAGFTAEIVGALISRCQTERGWDLASLLLLTEPPQRLNRLVRLFVLRQPVSEAAVREALAPFPLERLISAGLIEDGQDGSLVSNVCLMPYQDLISLRDFGADWTARTVEPDFVMGISQSSISLAVTTVRQQGEEALDLGTGGGIQTLLAARHANRVIATDINPRALALTKLALQINGINNVELHQGNMFDPVVGQTFDLYGSWRITDTHLVQRRGFAFPCRVDRMSSEIVSGCDGSRTLRSVIESLAQRFSLDKHRLCEEALPIAGRLMKNGYLVPA